MNRSHIHAELIRKWADDPTIEIQWSSYHSERMDKWHDCPNPSWDTTFRYREKPKQDKETWVLEALNAGQRIAYRLKGNGDWFAFPYSVASIVLFDLYDFKVVEPDYVQDVLVEVGTGTASERITITCIKDGITNEWTAKVRPIS